MQEAVLTIERERDTEPIHWGVRFLPSLTDLAFLLPYFLVFGMLSGSSLLLSDGDTGWHIRTGDWILQHRAVPKVDLFSFTKTGQPWFAWEWASDVLLSTIHRSSGLAGVVFGVMLLLGVVSVLLFRLIRRSCENDVVAFAFTLIAMCGSTLHWLARPHLVSWVFILVFAHVILSAEQGRRKLLAWLPVLTVIWTNMHGGFFVGILMVAISATGQAADALLREDASVAESWRRAKPYVISGAACALATLLNPYSWHLHEHIVEYLGDGRLLDNIQEFRSVDFHHGPVFFFELLLVLGIAAALSCLQRRQFAAAISICFWAHLALISARNVPLYLLIATPYAASMTADAVNRARTIPWLSKASRFVSDIGRELRPVERMERFHVASGMAVALVAVLMVAKHPGFQPGFNPKQFPTQALDRIAHADTGRIFTSDQWADYLIYKLYPTQRVYMDGRSDFYGSEFVTGYQHVMNAQYDWEANLSRFAIDTVVVKPDAPVATALKQSRAWKTVFDDGSTVIFTSARTEDRWREDVARNVWADPGDGAGKKSSIHEVSQENKSNSNLKAEERKSL